MSDEPPTLDAEWRGRIRRDPAEAMVRDLDVSVRQILLALSRGAAADQLLGDHPGLVLEDIRACLAYAAWVCGPQSADLAAAEAQTLPPADANAEAQTQAPAVPGQQLPTTAPTASTARGSAIQIPGYEILEELGRGGMGVVYKARSVRLERVVALKMILAGEYAGADMLERFQREAKAAAQLPHPGIVQVYEVGEHDGRPYIVQEFVVGGSLAARLDKKPWPAAKAAGLVEAMARALQAAHDHGIIHRDLKPENVLLTEDGQPKIADFGLAKRMDATDGKTRTGAILGTPSYMAPEQAAGRTSEIGPATDVYALGAILYRLLTGRPPFYGRTVLDVLARVMEQEPASVRGLNPLAPRDLETVALKCLRKNPAARYASAAELAGDLRRFMDGEAIFARRIGLSERLARWVRRRPGAAVARAVSALVFLGMAVALDPLIGTALLATGAVVFAAGARVRIMPFAMALPLAGAIAVVVWFNVVPRLQPDPPLKAFNPLQAHTAAETVQFVTTAQELSWAVDPYGEPYYTLSGRKWTYTQLLGAACVAALLTALAVGVLLTERLWIAAVGIVAFLAAPLLGGLGGLGIQFLSRALGYRDAAEGFPFVEMHYPGILLIGAVLGLVAAGIVRLAWRLSGGDFFDAAAGAAIGAVLGLIAGGLIADMAHLRSSLADMVCFGAFGMAGTGGGACLGAILGRKPRREAAR
jgi:uncharacterized protein (DUF433 family)